MLILAVTTYHETLPHPASPQGAAKLNDYVGACEEFTGVSMDGGRYLSLIVRAEGYDIHFFHIKHPWLKSDKIYAIIHDSPLDLEPQGFYMERLQAFVNLVGNLCTPLNPEGKISGCVMSRSDRPTHFNRVHYWEADIVSMAKWINRNSDTILVHNESSPKD